MSSGPPLLRTKMPSRFHRSTGGLRVPSFSGTPKTLNVQRDSQRWMTSRSILVNLRSAYLHFFRWESIGLETIPTHVSHRSWGRCFSFEVIRCKSNRSQTSVTDKTKQNKTPKTSPGSVPSCHRPFLTPTRLGGVGFPCHVHDPGWFEILPTAMLVIIRCSGSRSSLLCSPIFSSSSILSPISPS